MVVEESLTCSPWGVIGHICVWGGVDKQAGVEQAGRKGWEIRSLPVAATMIHCRFSGFRHHSCSIYSSRD